MNSPLQKKYEAIARFFSGNTEQTEQPVLDNDFQALRKVWSLTDKIAAPEPPAEQWNKLLAKIKSQEPVSKPKTIPYLLRLAAALAIVFLSYWIIHSLIFDTTIVTTKNAETRLIRLPDSSTVELNAATTIEYGNTSRTVLLYGEAFFQVRPGVEAFVVRTEDAEVTVLGTAFNVRARGASTEVAVQHGLVEFSNPVFDAKVQIKPSEMSRMTVSGLPSAPEQVDVKKYFAWREGKFEFIQAPLIEVFAELERRFDVKIDFGSTKLFGKTLTASFEAGQTVNEILYSICLTFGLTEQQTEAGYTIQ